MTAGTPAMTYTLPMRKPGAIGDRVLDQLGSRRDARHAPARGRQVAGRVALEHDGDYPRILVDRDAERARDRVGGDVVVGRPDASGRDHVVVTRSQRVERRDDLVLDVGDDARLPNVDADLRQIFGDIAEVAVLGAAGEDFVADHEHGGGYGRRFVHRQVPSARRGSKARGYHEVRESRRQRRSEESSPAQPAPCVRREAGHMCRFLKRRQGTLR